MPDPIEVEVVCPSTHDEYYCVTCNDTDVVRATLAPGTLSEAYHRLGVAAMEFDEADTAWTKAAHKPSGPHDQLKAAEERYDASLEAVNAALAEVRRLRPTPPEGT